MLLCFLSLSSKAVTSRGTDRPPAFSQPRRPSSTAVDRTNGKPATTEYRFIGKTVYGKDGKEAVKIALYPLTGRHPSATHPLCTSRRMGTPIIGDNLYGQRAERLWLHAEYLEFTHPITQRRMSFDTPL